MYYGPLQAHELGHCGFLGLLFSPGEPYPAWTANGHDLPDSMLLVPRTTIETLINSWIDEIDGLGTLSNNRMPKPMAPTHKGDLEQRIVLVGCRLLCFPE